MESKEKQRKRNRVDEAVALRRLSGLNKSIIITNTQPVGRKQQPQTRVGTGWRHSQSQEALPQHQWLTELTPTHHHQQTGRNQTSNKTWDTDNKGAETYTCTSKWMHCRTARTCTQNTRAQTVGRGMQLRLGRLDNQPRRNAPKPPPNTSTHTTHTSTYLHTRSVNAQNLLTSVCAF